VTHDIDEAIKMGDRVAIMREGKLVQHDTPDVLLAEPRDDFVRSFVGADRELKRLGLVHVREIMNRNPLAVTTATTAEDALASMQQRGVRTVFIVDEQGRLAGWADERELRAGATLAAALHKASLPDVVVRENASVREALSALLARGFGVTPVVDDAGHLRGSVTLVALQELAEQRANGTGAVTQDTRERRTEP
jgi:osmoprotectant transport system ATP-binding protein